MEESLINMEFVQKTNEPDDYVRVGDVLDVLYSTEKYSKDLCYNDFDVSEFVGDMVLHKLKAIKKPVIKYGYWKECWRDNRCISVICSVCDDVTAVAHGRKDAEEVMIEDVIDILPYCPKCRANMRRKPMAMEGEK